jgi:hypothetical protein
MLKVEERSFVAEGAPLDDGQSRVGDEVGFAAEPEEVASAAGVRRFDELRTVASGEWLVTRGEF